MPLGLGEIIGGVGTVAKEIVDRFWPKKMSEEEKVAAAQAIEGMLAAREAEVVKASRDIMVAELEQGDNYTKRARPTIIYIGLAAVVFNYVFLPFVNRIMEWVTLLGDKSLEKFGSLTPIDLPADFWYVWGGVCSIYALGRSAEKRGARSQVLGWITGNKVKNGG